MIPMITLRTFSFFSNNKTAFDTVNSYRPPAFPNSADLCCGAIICM